MKKRIEWIDILRGFAIILIVLGHTIGYSTKLRFLSKYLSSFYVPLFFIISGYTNKIKEDESFIKYFKRKFKTILLPYFIFALLSLIPYYLFSSNVGIDLDTKRLTNNNFFQSLLYILWGSNHNKGLSQNSPLWFLPCYFSVLLISKIVSIILKKLNLKYRPLILSLIFLILGFLTYKYLNYAYPYQLETSIVMLYFFYLGNLLKDFKTSKNKEIIISIISLILGFIIHTFNGRISCMNNNYANSYFIFIISATFTIIGYIYLFKQFKNLRILKYLGKHTIPILVMHKMPLILFQTKIKIISSPLRNGSITVQLLTSIIVAIICIFLCIIVYKVTSKILPFIYGENKA